MAYPSILTLAIMHLFYFDMKYPKDPQILTGCQSTTHFVKIAIMRSIYFGPQLFLQIPKVTEQGSQDHKYIRRVIAI